MEWDEEDLRKALLSRSSSELFFGDESSGLEMTPGREKRWQRIMTSCKSGLVHFSVKLVEVLFVFSSFNVVALRAYHVEYALVRFWIGTKAIQFFEAMLEEDEEIKSSLVRATISHLLDT